MTLLQIPLVLGEQTVNPGLINDFLLMLLKVFFVIGGILYVAFSVVVMRQISVMRNTLVTSFASKLRLLGLIHFIVALAALVYFLLSL